MRTLPPLASQTAIPALSGAIPSAGLPSRISARPYRKGAISAHSTGRLFSRPSRSHSSARLRRSSCAIAVIELMRPGRQRISKVEGVIAPAGVRVFFIAQP